MGRFEGTYLKLASYRDAYIAATRAVERAGSRVEAVKTRMMLGDKAAEGGLDAAQEELAAAQKEAARLHCLWTTGLEPETARVGIVWKDSLGRVRPESGRRA